MTLVYIGLLWVFAYHCLAIQKDFRGSSKTALELYRASGVILNTAFIIVLICSFWHFKWYWPIVTSAAGIFVGGSTAFVFQWTIVGRILSPILGTAALVMSILGLVGVL